MKGHIAGKPEGYVGRIGWSMAAAGIAGDDTAMRMTELPVKPGTTAATVEGIMEGLSSSEDVKALQGLVGAESTLVDGKLITISKYENVAGIEARRKNEDPARANEGYRGRTGSAKHWQADLLVCRVMLGLAGPTSIDQHITFRARADLAVIYIYLHECRRVLHSVQPPQL